MDDPVFMGLDLSLTSSGVALLRHDGTPCMVHSLKPGSHKGLDRVRFLSDQLRSVLPPTGRFVVAVEGYAMGRFVGMMFDRAEWIGQAKLMLYETGRCVSLIVPPTSLKQYATGAGNADKKAMCDAAYNAYGPCFTNDDEADALFLASVAREWWFNPLHDIFLKRKGKKVPPVLPAHPLPFQRGEESTPHPVRKRKRTPVR